MCVIWGKIWYVCPYLQNLADPSFPPVRTLYRITLPQCCLVYNSEASLNSEVTRHQFTCCSSPVLLSETGEVLLGSTPSSGSRKYPQTKVRKINPGIAATDWLICSYSGVYRSSSLMEVYAVHQQIVTKTGRFYGHGIGALSLCAAAVRMK